MNNRFLIFLASFLTLIAAGLGFGVRTELIQDWGNTYGFTQGELGLLTGGGLAGFGAVIIFASLIIDWVGYRLMLGAAFVLHVLCAVIYLCAGPVFDAYGSVATWHVLNIATWTFAIANGLCEAAINPLVATLYPRQKTHYLNILHAGWPLGLVAGALLAGAFAADSPWIAKLAWQYSAMWFLIPVILFGIITLTQKFPTSEAVEAGVSFGEMVSTLAAPILVFLLVLHALVGYVELGTDSWITNITNQITGSYGLILFIFASGIMFVLRFFAGPIVHHINPVGLLLGSTVFGVAGLLLISYSGNVPMAFLAVGVYGLGKTFLWPTMLGIVGERYPRGGALVMGLMGGIGMLSAGLIGAPAIGHLQDVYASQELQELSEANSTDTYERYAVGQPNSFYGLFPVRGLDGSKVDLVLAEPRAGAEPSASNAKYQKLLADIQVLTDQNRSSRELDDRRQWWETQGQPNAVDGESDQLLVEQARVYGGRMALRWTALVPALMFVGYLILFVYFSLTGGYKQEHLDADVEKADRGEPFDETAHTGEEFTGGQPGPVR